MSDQVERGMFKRFTTNDSLCNANLHYNLEILFNFVEEITGVGCKIMKTSDGKGCSIVLDNSGSSNDPLADYEEEELNVVTDGKIIKRTVLVKSDVDGETPNKSDVATWGSPEEKELLQVENVSGEYVLRVDKGYFKS